jgi:hypothetical protein
VLIGLDFLQPTPEDRINQQLREYFFSFRKLSASVPRSSEELNLKFLSSIV